MLYLNLSNDILSRLDRVYIENIAHKSLDTKTISITDNQWKKQYKVSPNEYLSLSTYHQLVDGKIVKSDIPNQNKYLLSDKKYIPEIVKHLQNLSIAYIITKNNIYANKAINFLKCFFIDSATCMIPRLDYSGIRVRNSTTNEFTTHGVIIDTHEFWIIVDFINIILGSNSANRKFEADIKLWFNTLANWLMYSWFGNKASQTTNNWLTIYYLQTLSYLMFCDQKELAKTIFINNFERILSTQIDIDGKQPEELSRTNKIHYCNFNLHMITKLAILAKHFDIDLWSFENDSGRGNIYKAMLYSAQMIKDNNTTSELNNKSYNLTWLKIAHSIYQDNIFTELYIQYEKNNEYYLDHLLNLT